MSKEKEKAVQQKREAMAEAVASNSNFRLS
jgi:hypothetical protein